MNTTMIMLGSLLGGVAIVGLSIWLVGDVYRGSAVVFLVTLALLAGMYLLSGVA